MGVLEHGQKPGGEAIAITRELADRAAPHADGGKLRRDVERVHRDQEEDDRRCGQIHQWRAFNLPGSPADADKIDPPASARNRVDAPEGRRYFPRTLIKSG